jgi:hypothetical protein
MRLKREQSEGRSEAKIFECSWLKSLRAVSRAAGEWRLLKLFSASGILLGNGEATQPLQAYY